MIDHDEYKKKIAELEEENLKLKSTLNHYKFISDDLQNHLNNIYNSNGWKFLSKYYRIRDKFLLTRKFAKKPNMVVPLATENTLDKVSVIIPVYNNSKYLKKCLESALNQTYSNVEVIAIDDNSTESEVTSILESLKDNTKFRFYRNDFNVGISETMNRAISKSEGNWIAFLDCDDWLEHDAIEKLMNNISQKNAVYGYTDRINEYEIDGSSKVETFRNRPTENYLKELYVGMYVSHLKIIRKDVFLKTGLHESRFDGAQDYDMALKVAFHFGDSFAYLSEAVYHHRIHEKQTTIEAAKKIENIVQTIRKETKLRMDIKEGIFDSVVSFVILSFEKKEMTLKCVESIKNTVKIPYEIIIFDNASSDDTRQYLKNYIEHQEHITMFYSDVNLGCPGGRRAATKMAKGDYIVNLDNDIIVTENWIEELIVRVEHEPKIGAVCCKTVFPNGEIQFNGGSYLINDEFITFLLTDNSKNENDVATAQWHECSWVPGGATLFKRSVVNQLDYSIDYINAFEDNDIALQITKLGYKMYNCPSAKVYHYHIMFNDNQVNKEKDYMRVRYNNEGFIKSLVNFYRRNQLIINDPFVHRLMGVEGESVVIIKDKVESYLEPQIFMN
ncbi:glycosyltransferase [Paenibacillus aestuarii]|uniref:Glycosyltransferase n=1 Tax=Paenibacillus aestuarii TaxID=516965 RepID=A0ABW0K0P3_9BACL|nr:glycosyltransferase [Paenibacillus aestuarii]